MHSTVNREQREKLHSDQLMNELKIIQDNKVSKPSFVLEKERLEKKSMMEMLMKDMEKFEELREQKKKLAEKVFEPMLEEKGVYFKKKIMKHDKFEEMYPRLLEQRQLNPYHVKCARSSHTEAVKSHTPVRKPKKNVGAPSFMEREKQPRITDRIDPDARDHRRKTHILSKTPTMGTKTPRTPPPTTPPTRKPLPKPLLLNPPFMAPLKRPPAVPSPQQSPPRYGNNSQHLSIHQLIDISDRLHDDHISKDERSIKLWNDRKRYMFKPRINEVRYSKKDVRQALNNFDDMIMNMENKKHEFEGGQEKVYKIPISSEKEKRVKKRLMDA